MKNGALLDEKKSDVKQGVLLDEKKDAHFDERKDAKSGEKKDAHFDEKKDIHFDEKKNAHFDLVGGNSLDEKKDAHFDEKKDVHFDEKKDGHFDEKKDIHFDEKKNAHFDLVGVDDVEDIVGLPCGMAGSLCCDLWEDPVARCSSNRFDSGFGWNSLGRLALEEGHDEADCHYKLAFLDKAASYCYSVHHAGTYRPGCSYCWNNKGVD